MEALRDVLRENKLEAYLLTNLSDVYYFTDFKTEGYYAFIGLQDAWLFVPSLLFQQTKAHTSGFECIQGTFFPSLQKVTKAHKIKKIGFDPDQLDYSLGAALKKMGFIPKRGLVTQLRAVKDALELDRMRRANHLAALGADFVKKRLKPGRTERSAAADLAHFFNKKSDGVAFDLIIAAGPHSSHPHHVTSDYKMKAGEPVICDIGAMVEGYRSDLTRTFPLGRISPSFQRVFRIVEKAQNEGICRIKPGVTAGSVDEAARNVIKKHGFGKEFVHSTGHGVGIDIHEHPRLGPGAKDKLKAGMVITVEPGIYIPGRFGVRIEDTLLVTPFGSEILTR